MSDTTSKSDKNAQGTDEAGPDDTPSGQAGVQATPPRTGTAALTLLKALKSDMGGFFSRFSFRRVLAGFALIIAIAVLVLASGIIWAVNDLSIDKAMTQTPARTVVIEAADGSPLGRMGSLQSDAAAREAFPDHLIDAVLSIEDQRFYSHFGVDPIGIARAFGRNFSAGRIVEGGSTITQQLVKLRLLSNEQTMHRKAREAFAAVWLELLYSKDEILTRYLNSIYMGAGAYGIPAAAQRYFGKEPAELSLQEAALLAGLIKAPSRYNPLENPEAAHRRAGLVLDAMVKSGAIAPQQAADARRQPVALSPPVVASPTGTWFADWVSRETLSLSGAFRGPVRVRTTLDPALQALGERVVRNALAENAERGVTQAALVAMRPDGAVLAMVGGRDYEDSQFNRAVQAERQPGSTFKLFVYLAALRNGATLETPVDTRAPEIDGWQPENFSEENYGPLPLGEAFARSINTAAVNLALKVGLDQVADAARDMGIDAPLNEVPSLALGAEETSLLDLTAAYAAVLAGRAPVEPWGVAALGPADQQRLMAVASPDGGGNELGVDRETLIDLLRRPVTSGTARNAALDGFAAGKTGTSQDFRDAWFIGFDNSLVVGIWTGNDDSTPMDGVTGGSLPATMWKTFMENRGTPAAAPPAIALNRQTGETPPDIEADASQDDGGFFDRFQEKAPEVETTSDEGGEQKTADAQEEQTGGVCDIRACSRAYRSFDPTDCTFQPYGGGPRKRCDRTGEQDVAERTESQDAAEPAGGQDAAERTDGQDAAARTGGRDAAERPSDLPRVINPPPAHCNFEACDRTYRSFRGSDCTYQPRGGGPRQVCYM